MLDLLGTIGGNVLSLPGILGLALGMMTRNIYLGAALGGLVGIVETLVFAGFDFQEVHTLELIVAVAVGSPSLTVKSATENASSALSSNASTRCRRPERPRRRARRGLHGPTFHRLRIRDRPDRRYPARVC